MKLKYKILWFEDNLQWYNSMLPSIREFLEERGFELKCDRESDGQKLDELLKNDYDLILMDYNLAGVKGDALIDKIRDHEFYTEIVFYAQTGESVVRSIMKAKAADGVYCSSRDFTEFEGKVTKVIHTTIKKVEDLNNMRGLVMAEVSDLDQKMIKIIKKYHISIDEEKKEELKKYIQKKIIKSLEDKLKKANEILNNEGLEGLMEHPIFESSMKWIIVTHLCKEINNVPDLIDHLKILNYYPEEIISMRNTLAHLIEEITAEGLTVFKGLDFIFNDESCIAIRKNLKKHSLNFDNIHNVI